MWLRGCLFLLSVLLGVPLVAATYKCVDADGNVTYSQTACPAVGPPRQSSTGGDRPSATDAQPGRRDGLCERVHAFALELAWAMSEGVGLDGAVSTLGDRAGSVGSRHRQDHAPRFASRSGVGDDTLAIINHVFAFAGRGAVAPTRIADSAAARCRGGGFDFERGAPGGANGLRRSAGSGMLLNHQGMVLTADRLLGDCSKMRVFGGGAWHDARILRRDATLGLAVLVAGGLQGRPAVLTDADGPLAPDLFAASLPLRGVLTGRTRVVNATALPGPRGVDGPVSAAGSEAEAAPVDPASMPLDLPPGPAQSGAPLIGSGGLVAGIALPAAASALRALPAAAVRGFLSDADLACYSAAALGRLSRDEVRRRADGFTVHVECRP